jgi:hypothetical protein
MMIYMVAMARERLQIIGTALSHGSSRLAGVQLVADYLAGTRWDWYM